MNAIENMAQVLYGRRDEIADKWYQAIIRTSFASVSTTKVRQRLVELTEQAIALLLAESFERRQAEAIGASLAALHYIQPQTLGRTQEVLASQLVAGLPADRVIALQPRLAALLGGLAAGFSQHAREVILSEQEQIRSAFIAELQSAEQALRKHTEQLRILHEIDTAILATQSPEEISQAVLDHVRQLVPYVGASVVLFDFQAREGTVLFADVSGESTIRAGTCFSLDALPGVDVALEALRGGEVHVTEKISILAQALPALQDLQAKGLRAALILPLVVQEELIGFLGLGAEGRDVFGTGQVEVVRKMADSLAIAIQQARLFEAVRRQGQQLRAVTARLAEVEEAERQRLARDLHDMVGQNLNALGINLNLIQAHMPEEMPELARSRLDDSLALVQETTASIRRVMDDLRPPMLDDFGLVATLHWYGARFASRTGVAVKVQGEEPVPRLAAPIENALFRVVQEGLTNVAKHARATQVTVTVEANDGTVRLIVTDNGVGFEPMQVATPNRHGGWGLITMVERAEAVGGRCRVESLPQQGTRIIVEVVP